jgi:hypothetical protein
MRFVWCPSTASGRDIELGAARWIRGRSLTAVLMSDAPLVSDAAILEHFPDERRWTRRARVEIGRAVLLYEASYPTIADGLSPIHDDGFAAVLELASCPMLGWAQAVGAMNLATGGIEQPLTTSIADAARTIADLSYNGLVADPARRAVPVILDELHAAGSLTPTLPSAVLAFAPWAGHTLDALTQQVERLIG